MADDTLYMRRALELARLGWGLTSPNPLVGAVIVRDGETLGEGFHARAGEPHAEIMALRAVAGRGCPVAGSTMYVTLEPCSTIGRTPRCTDAIVAAGLARVVIGAADPNPAHAGRGVELLRRAGIAVECGVEGASCEELNAPFFTWITTKKPLVWLKLAMTLDGKIATPDGESKWITGPGARGRVQELRRLADAVLVGGETVRQDHPQLLVREPADWPRQPKRFVASRRLTPAALQAYFPDGEMPEIVNLPDAAAWDAFLLELGGRGMTMLLIEGGGELAAAALRAGAVDRVEFHVAPKILGGAHSRPAVGGADPARLAEAIELENTRVTHYGDDFAVGGTVKRR
jgi:diaminohydroxyphosphoribosylaminopyrimidine deaminase/5-amino-6-(5-phosphoribosylamino)uracil reductase